MRFLFKKERSLMIIFRMKINTRKNDKMDMVLKRPNNVFLPQRKLGKRLIILDNHPLISTWKMSFLPSLLRKGIEKRFLKGKLRKNILGKKRQLKICFWIPSNRQ